MAVIQDDETFQRWAHAGQVAAAALEVGRDAAKEGVRLVDLVETVERYVLDAGLNMAFPCTASLNACAAHFTPDHADETVLQNGDLVKIDCGAELDGALSDNAVTVEIGSGGHHTELIKASEACLETAISILGPNCNLGDVGAAIELTANDMGFKTIQNLTGHSLETYNLHAGLTVPNVGMRIKRRPRIGDVLACEPFVTDGQSARVGDSGMGNIYHFQRQTPQRLPSAKRLAGAIQQRHPKLPFAERWVADAIDPRKLRFNLSTLQKTGVIKHYPALSETSGGMVSQREATIIITEDGCAVTTDPQGVRQVA